MQGSPSKTCYTHCQNPIAVGSVGGIVDLSRDVTDVAECYKLLGLEVPTKSDGFVSSSDGFMRSCDDVVSWPDNSVIVIDAPVTELDALTGF